MGPSFWPKNFVLVQLLYMVHRANVSALQPSYTFSSGPAALSTMLPLAATGCACPCCSLVLPVPFPAMYRVGPEPLTPTSPFRTTFLPERFHPLPLLCNPCTCHILPFTLAHHHSYPPKSVTSALSETVRHLTYNLEFCFPPHCPLLWLIHLKQASEQS